MIFATFKRCMNQLPTSIHNLKFGLAKDGVQFLSNVINDKKADSRILEWAGFIALENQKWEMAENIFSSLLERRNKALDLLGLGKALYRQARLDEAEECYLEALNQIVEPCNLLFITYKSLGEIHILQNNFPMAEEYYNKASMLNPSCKNIMFHRAMMYLKEKNYIEAEKNFQLFIKSHLNHDQAWIGLAITRKVSGDDDLALACLKRSLDFNPNNKKALRLKQKWENSFSSRKSLTQSLSCKSLSFSV